MVDSKWSYSITHYDLSNNWATQNLTADFISAPVFTDTGDGTVNSAIIKIDANKGHYVRDARSGESGFPTKIDIFDRIEITVLDGDGGSYQKYFDVMKKVPMKDERQGTVLQLELIGIEGWLQRVNYTNNSFLLNAKELLTDLVTVYNDNRTSKMPTLSVGTNELPPLFMNLDWGNNEDSIYNRLMDLLNALGASTSNGGVLDYFEATFTTLYNSITLNIISAGNATNGKPDQTISGDVDIVSQGDGSLSGASGTMISAWGANDAGSLPVEWSKFKSRRMLMPTNNNTSLFPTWDSNYSYKQDSTVKYKTTNDFQVWKRTSSVNSTIGQAPSVANGWTLMTTETYYGASMQYSPWTKGNNIYWKNSGADPSGAASSPYGPAMWDGNIVINDDTTFRTWVDLVSTTSVLNAFWLYGAAQSGVYDGLRVLVNGTGTGSFAGYNNYVMEYSNGVWTPKYSPNSNMLVACFDTARVYKYTGSVWSDISSQGNALDCFHPMDDGTTHNSSSAFGDKDTGGEYTGNTLSSVKVSYTWTPLDDWTTSFGGTTLDYYKSGAWLSLRFPLPINTCNYASGHVIGEAYGGNATTKYPTAVDIQNMTYTHDGKKGFNWGNSSEDLGPINAIDFTMKIIFSGKKLIGDALTQIDAGNFKMRCVCIDRNDNVAYQDFVIDFNNNWINISLPISGFITTRNLRPRVVSLSDLTPPKAVDTSYMFEWRHLKMITFQTQESYDDHGRYLAGNGRFGIGGTGVTISGLPDAYVMFNIQLFLDAFHFTKPLLVNSGNVTGSDTIPLLIEPDFLQRTDIFIYDQLKNDVLSEIERFRFPVEEYSITTDGEFNIKYNDFFYYKDAETVDRTDNEDNKIKLVAKSIDYSITKPVDGNGGFQRTVRGFRRFV